MLRAPFGLSALLGSLVVALGLASAGCETGEFHFADDVKIQFAEGEKVASVKSLLGCEGAHPAEESKEDKEAREKLVPQTDLGKAWLEEACKLADDFEKAGPVTAWPEGDKATWVGKRICRGQITRVVEKVDDTAFAQVGRLEIAKGKGDKLWATGPSPDAARILDYKILFSEQSFPYSEKKQAEIDAFFAAVSAGGKADIEALRKDETADQKADAARAEEVAKKHTVWGMLAKSDGTSTLAYPVLGSKDDVSAIHYLRQSGDKLLVVTPNIGASSPNACVAELVQER